MKKPIKILSVLVWVIFCIGIYSRAEAARFNVLVVMSYEKPEINPWCREIKEGIDSVLGGKSKIDYFYMNTKINFDGGKQKAKKVPKENEIKNTINRKRLSICNFSIRFDKFFLVILKFLPDFCQKVLL